MVIRIPSCYRAVLLVALGLLVFGISAALVSAQSAQNSTGSSRASLQSLAPDATTAVGPSCRYGVAALSSNQSAWLSTLSAGWYLNFHAEGDSADPAEYAPVVRLKQNKQDCAYLSGFTVAPPLTSSGLGALVLARPGALWLVGNEPDRGPNPENCSQGVQDDLQPEVYAQAYHDVYRFIKTLDPSARVANAGLVEATPGRLQYLDKIWSAYQQKYGQTWPVDVWNMHVYILPEVDVNGNPNGIAGVAVGTDPALGIRESGSDKNRCADPGVYCWAEHDDMGEFAKQVVAMRAWMKLHGQQDKALILSEYSLLYPYQIDGPGQCWLADEFGNCFTPTRVRDFMNRSMDYLEAATDPTIGYPRDENRLVQRWLWFSARANGAGAASNLLDNSELNLTLPGQNYQVRAGAAGRSLNFYPSSTSAMAPPSFGAATPANATLSTIIKNVGSAASSGNVTVTFYADEALTKPIASAVITETLRGCQTNEVRASVSWPGQAPGRRDYWVVVDPENNWAETNEGDNKIKGTLFVGSAWTFLPIVLR